MSGMNSCIIMPAYLLQYIITHHVNHVNHGFENIKFKTLDTMHTMDKAISYFLTFNLIII